jgi:hypothetical protein
MGSTTPQRGRVGAAERRVHDRVLVLIDDRDPVESVSHLPRRSPDARP